jgi:hypothetical protein
MRLICDRISWFRLMVLSWASVWMLAAPLFHVHPEADHRHGEVGHVHGGTVHTVWSPDLDCEFEGHGHADSGYAQFAHVGDGHTEFSLALLNDSTDRKSLKPFLAQAFGFSSVAASDVEQSVRIVWNTTSVQLSVPSLHTHSPRAPPSLRV